MATVKSDRARFQEKLKYNVKKNLKNVINGEFQSIKGGKLIKVPVDSIHMPRIRYDTANEGGVGRGDGEAGDIIGTEKGDGSDQGTEGGNQAGRHSHYAELDLDELAEILGEELELPKILPKGHRTLFGEKDKYNSIAQNGPDSLKHKKRTLKKAILRGRPKHIPYNNDFEYKSFTRKPSPMNNAVIFYMQDVSSSMSRDQLEIVRIVCFWIETWLKKQYDNVDQRYILHDTIAGEVTRDDFYRYDPSGGTSISTAFNKMNEIIKKSYPVDDWNIYPFYFGDGMNWTQDTKTAIDIIKNDLLPISNQLSIGMIEPDWMGMGSFGKDLLDSLNGTDDLIDKVVIDTIKNRDDCFNAIKTFLSKGN